MQYAPSLAFFCKLFLNSSCYYINNNYEKNYFTMHPLFIYSVRSY